MLHQPTLELLHELRLPGMAEAFEEQLGMPEIGELTFEDRLALLLEREKTDRANRRFQRLLGQARLHLDASIEDLNFKKARGLDRSLVSRLADSEWIRQGHTLLVSDRLEAAVAAGWPAGQASRRPGAPTPPSR